MARRSSSCWLTRSAFRCFTTRNLYAKQLRWLRCLRPKPLFNVGAATQQLINKEKGDYRHYFFFVLFLEQQFKLKREEERRREKTTSSRWLSASPLCPALSCPAPASQLNLSRWIMRPEYPSLNVVLKAENKNPHTQQKIQSKVFHY